MKIFRQIVMWLVEKKEQYARNKFVISLLSKIARRQAKDFCDCETNLTGDSVEYLEHMYDKKSGYAIIVHRIWHNEWAHSPVATILRVTNEDSGEGHVLEVTGEVSVPIDARIEIEDSKYVMKIEECCDTGAWFYSVILSDLPKRKDAQDFTFYELKDRERKSFWGKKWRYYNVSDSFGKIIDFVRYRDFPSWVLTQEIDGWDYDRKSGYAIVKYSGWCAQKRLWSKACLIKITDENAGEGYVVRTIEDFWPNKYTLDVDNNSVVVGNKSFNLNKYGDTLDDLLYTDSF